jgi:hypothetical protein
VRVGGRRGAEFHWSGEAILDTVESFTLGRSTTVQIASRHLFFEAERKLYECVIEGSPNGVDSHGSVFIAFCASVAET